MLPQGLEPAVRKEAWPFLLGVVPFASTAVERTDIWSKKQLIYSSLRASKTLDGATRAKADVAEEIHRIHVDCRRTDRGHPMFEAAQPVEGEPTEDESGESTNRASFSGRNCVPPRPDCLPRPFSSQRRQARRDPPHLRPL